VGKPSGLAALRTAKTHARIRAHAFGLIVTHRCARCGWVSTGELGVTLPAFETHECPASVTWSSPKRR
jgi:hypothetical protein